jgi:hypothetical protein
MTSFQRNSIFIIAEGLTPIYDLYYRNSYMSDFHETHEEKDVKTWGRRNIMEKDLHIQLRFASSRKTK